MWNINRGFKFAHDVEDRHTEGKLGKLLRSGEKNFSFYAKVQLVLSQEA